MEITPFISAEEMWFWFIQANQARNDGARMSANKGAVIRPCVPDDILKILSRLHRNRRLNMNHFRVMRHYGVRMIAPDQFRPAEYTAWHLWSEAMSILEDVLIAKDVVVPALPANVIAFKDHKACGVRLSW